MQGLLFRGYQALLARALLPCSPTLAGYTTIGRTTDGNEDQGLERNGVDLPAHMTRNPTPHFRWRRCSPDIQPRQAAYFRVCR